MAANYHQVTVGYGKFFIDERYTNLKPIGDGSYGLVASALDTVTGQKVAIKKIKDAFSDLVDAKRILRELKLLGHFGAHENIISLIDVMTTPPNTVDFDDIYLVTNLMESDLERIINSKQALTDQHFQFFLYQLLRGLKYVHSANVLHRDLKPGNILVNANCDLAICDFGLSRGFDFEGATMTEYVVTRWYRPPELLCESPHYGKAVDVWAVGCIFGELLRHEALFQGESPQNQLEVIVSKLGCPPRHKLEFVESSAALEYILRWQNRRPPAFESLFPPGSSKLALDLINKMLQFHPDDRITVEDALHHPYLKDFRSQSSEPTCDRPFNFDFERMDGPMSTELTKREVQELMFEEVVKFRPLRGVDAKGGDAKAGRPVLRDNYSFDAESKDHVAEEKGSK